MKTIAILEGPQIMAGVGICTLLPNTENENRNRNRRRTY